MRKGFDTPLADNILMPFAEGRPAGLEWFIVLFARCRCHAQREKLSPHNLTIVGVYFLSGPQKKVVAA